MIVTFDWNGVVRLSPEVFAKIIVAWANHGHAVHLVTSARDQKYINIRRRWLREYRLEDEVQMHMVGGSAKQDFLKARAIAELGSDLHMGSSYEVFRLLTELSPRTIQLMSLNPHRVFKARRGR